MSASPISVAITTHNRVQDLRRTLEVLSGYGAQVREVLVCADGCTDGTQDHLRTHFPAVLLMENNPGRGSIPSRNRLITAATAPLVLLLDDDSYPIEPHFFSTAARIMEAHPEIGVLTFPQRSDEFPASLTQADFGADQRTGTFTSSGSVIRRSLFLELGGFPEMFFHAYEEPDFSLRVIAAGRQVVQCSRLTVRHHFTAAMRNEGRTHRRHARNELWSTVMRAPAVYLLPALLYRVGSQFRYAASRGWDWAWREPQWWWAAAGGLRAAWRQRNPVPRAAYRRWLSLMRQPETLDSGDLP